MLYFLLQLVCKQTQHAFSHLYIHQIFLGHMQSTALDPVMGTNSWKWSFLRS